MLPKKGVSLLSITVGKPKLGLGDKAKFGPKGYGDKEEEEDDVAEAKESGSSSDMHEAGMRAGAEALLEAIEKKDVPGVMAALCSVFELHNCDC